MARYGWVVGIVGAGALLAGACGTAFSGGGGGTGASAGQSAGGGGAGAGAHGGTSQGGGGQGGTPHGGNAQGGTAQGGHAQGGGGSAPGLPPECTEASECKLVDDCCNCMALPVGAPPPPCNIPNCFLSACGTLGLDGVTACQAGRCVAGFACDPSSVTCMTPTPVCGPGETPSVKNGCWGSCVRATECATVGACEQCDATSQVCVRVTGQVVVQAHCVERPPSCGPDVGCDCMGSSVCVGLTNACADIEPGVLDCSCPNC